MSQEITVTVRSSRGSAPRDAGATMRVGPDDVNGTIGGGALEWEAIRIARTMLADGTLQAERTFPLGPDLGQCCGGAVTLDFIADAPDIEPTEPPIWIWGAGHVGRAIAATLAPFEDLPITLIDTDARRFPAEMPQGVTSLIAADMPRAMAHAPADARHIILTYSHDIDLALCDAVLRQDFAECGLIGSATKWARFRKRLGQLGHADAQISRILCPIGDPRLGKHPQAIAVGVAARLLDKQMLQESADASPTGGL
ncbi:xanthine dehydrogenase accessory protein XdhC [Gymnodinialimonas sp. 2305UL16-5]|uniref:xanthine dehydrogenase accessory protein XdhC n=1 Tax=Gymnodinialimonas mytili TaxID=3126503 RepID=UPI0030B039D4